MHWLCGTARLMGILEAEFALRPNNLEGQYNNTKFGLSEDEYTRQVDDGIFAYLIHDLAVYG